MAEWVLVSHFEPDGRGGCAQREELLRLDDGERALIPLPPDVAEYVRALRAQTGEALARREAQLTELQEAVIEAQSSEARLRLLLRRVMAIPTREQWAANPATLAEVEAALAPLAGGPEL